MTVGPSILPKLAASLPSSNLSQSVFVHYCPLSPTSQKLSSVSNDYARDAGNIVTIFVLVATLAPIPDSHFH